MNDICTTVWKEYVLSFFYQLLLLARVVKVDWRGKIHRHDGDR